MPRWLRYNPMKSLKIVHTTPSNQTKLCKQLNLFVVGGGGGVCCCYTYDTSKFPLYSTFVSCGQFHIHKARISCQIRKFITCQQVRYKWALTFTLLLLSDPCVFFFFSFFFSQATKITISFFGFHFTGLETTYGITLIKINTTICLNESKFFCTPFDHLPFYGDSRRRPAFSEYWTERWHYYVTYK